VGDERNIRGRAQKIGAADVVGVCMAVHDVGDWRRGDGTDCCEESWAERGRMINHDHGLACDEEHDLVRTVRDHVSAVIVGSYAVVCGFGQLRPDRSTRRRSILRVRADGCYCSSSGTHDQTKCDEGKQEIHNEK